MFAHVTGCAGHDNSPRTEDTAMPQATFDLVLSREKVLLFYKAKKNRIQVTARDAVT